MAFRSEAVRPCKEQCDREPDQGADNCSSANPARYLEWFTGRYEHLDCQPGNRKVSGGDASYVSAPEILEECR